MSREEVACYDCARAEHHKCKSADGAWCTCDCAGSDIESEECECGHVRGIHFQDGCMDKSGGGHFCACQEFEEKP